MTPILEVKNLVKSFTMHILNGKKIDALHNVSFTVNEGEVVGLIGKSGSGKSTLMKCIYRTYLSNSGEILFHSKDYGVVDLVTAQDHEVLFLRKNDINYCSQFLHVIPRVSAVDIVAGALIPKGVSWENARAKAKEYLELLGLPKELWDAFPSTFSGGEQQRINVARAIIAEPRFLVIDEPTSSLDPKTKDIVIDMVLKLKQKGTSVLCISHDQHTLDRMCDRLIALKFGEVVEESVVA
jgi:alpha-D-ribose 1-methylphosphonate 5-triphosphate synthase subunit PhnL